jgi:N-acetylneuraminate synthase/N,N'-diacetyllegionaminate synthase
MKKIPELTVAGRKLGGSNPCFVVAEAGANHEGKFELATELVDAAVSTKADSIKFQHYRAEKLTAREAKRYWYVRGDEAGFQFDPTTYKDSQASTFKKIDGIPREKDRELFAYGEERGILVFSTPFDFESVDHLEEVGVPMYKIASGDITHHAFIEYVAKKGKPVVLATGASNLDEIKAAVGVVRRTGNDQVVLLHCTLAYPSPLNHANLLMMEHLRQVFSDVLIGLSDHTPGIAADVAASILGAAMIEKHFTHTPGAAAGEGKVGESPDHDIGIGTERFREMVAVIRGCEAKGLSTRMGLSLASAFREIEQRGYGETLGTHREKKVDEAVELKARAQARRSVVSEVALTPGTKVTAAFAKQYFTVKRPGTGIAPYDLGELVGKTVKAGIPPDTVLRWEHFA